MYMLGINKLLGVFQCYLSTLMLKKLEISEIFYLKSKNGCNFYINKPSPYFATKN